MLSDTFQNTTILNTNTNTNISTNNLSNITQQMQFIYKALLNGWQVKHIKNDSFEFKKRKNKFTKNVDWNEDIHRIVINTMSHTPKINLTNASKLSKNKRTNNSFTSSIPSLSFSPSTILTGHSNQNQNPNPNQNQNPSQISLKNSKKKTI
jgi:hypothetical protein